MRIVKRRYIGEVEQPSRGSAWDWVCLFGWILVALFVGWSAARAYYWTVWIN